MSDTSRPSCTIAWAWESASARPPSSRGALAQHLAGRVAPAHAALGHLVHRRRPVGRQLAEDAPRLLARAGRGLGVPAGHPPGHRVGGDRAHLFEAVADQRRRFLHPSRCGSARQSAGAPPPSGHRAPLRAGGAPRRPELGCSQAALWAASDQPGSWVDEPPSQGHDSAPRLDSLRMDCARKQLMSGPVSRPAALLKAPSDAAAASPGRMPPRTQPRACARRARRPRRSSPTVRPSPASARPPGPAAARMERRRPSGR